MPTKPNCMSLVTVAVVAGILSATSIRAQDPSASVLAAKLETHYKLAKMDTDLNMMNAGTVLVIQRDGLLGVPPGSPVMCPATYKDGALHAPGAFDKMVCGNDVRAINNGEKVYLLKIEVNSKKDRVSLVVVECDSCNGATQFASYKSLVFFQFPKGYLAAAEPDQIEDIINQVLTIEVEPAQASENLPPAQAPSAPSLTNDDIIKLAQAKLPDSVLLTKIKSSTCDFDTSTNGLIQLKRAGVSDSVLQAMVDAPRPPDSGTEPPTPSPSGEPAHTPDCAGYDACMKIAQSLLESSQWVRALARFQDASQFDASKGDAWAGSGNAYFQMAQYDDAVNAWDKSLQLGAILSIDVCHAGALCSDIGKFLLSLKEVSFVNKKGEKEFSAAPSAITSEGAVLFSSAHPGYYLQIRFGKNWRFYYLPKNISCNMRFVCPEPGLTQQKIIGDYVHGALVRMAAGDFAPQPNKP